MNRLTQAGKVKGGWKSKSPSRCSYFLCSQDSPFLTPLPCITAGKEPLSGSSFWSGPQMPKACHPEAWCWRDHFWKWKGQPLFQMVPHSWHMLDLRICWSWDSQSVKFIHSFLSCDAELTKTQTEILISPQHNFFMALLFMNNVTVPNSR